MAIGLTYTQFKALNPCASATRDILAKIGGVDKWGDNLVTAQWARNAGVSFDNIVWAASAIAKNDKDVERRLRLWMADCAGRVLHIYENFKTSHAPRNAILATRAFACGEISAAARDAASAAASAAARAAAWDAAWSAASSAARDAASAAASAAARAAARDAASAAAWDAAWAAARDAANDDARDAARAAEELWQFDRLVERMSDLEPEDWPLPPIPERK